MAKVPVDEQTYLSQSEVDTAAAATTRRMNF